MSETPLTDALHEYLKARAELGRTIKLQPQPPGPNVGTLWRIIDTADSLAEVVAERLADVHQQMAKQLIADLEAICNE